MVTRSLKHPPPRQAPDRPQRPGGRSGAPNQAAPREALHGAKLFAKLTMLLTATLLLAWSTTKQPVHHYAHRHKALTLGAFSGNSASVVVPCGEAFDERLAWLCSLESGVEGAPPLLRVEEIGPADAPSYARVAGAGTSIWLTREGPASPLVLRLPATVPPPATFDMPIGCRAEVSDLDLCDFVQRSDPPPLEALDFDAAPLDGFISRARGEAGESWGVGRAGMLYRDLLPGRAGGALIASHIRIPGGGDVPDYVHYHRVHFQLIVCLAGWVEVVYEGQGAPFVLRPGDFVTQPPTIRHRVLRSSEGLEVLEIGAPATHATLADHAHWLPTSAEDDSSNGGDGRNVLPATALFGGQRFVRSVHAELWSVSPPPGLSAQDGLEWRESEVEAATSGLVRVRLGRSGRRAEAAEEAAEEAEEEDEEEGNGLEGFAPPPEGSLSGGAAPLASFDDAHLTLVFVRSGTASLATLGASGSGMRVERLERTDCATLPPGRPAQWLDASDDFELVEISFVKSEEQREQEALEEAMEEAQKEEKLLEDIEPTRAEE